LEKVEPSSSGDGDDSSDGDPHFSSDNGYCSEAEQGRAIEGVVKGIRMVNHHKRSGEVDIGREHEVQSLYRQQLMYYTISYMFVGILISHYIVRFSPVHVHPVHSIMPSLSCEKIHADEKN